MAKKPELIAFSQNKIGGVQNFFFYILSHDPYNFFEKKWIFIDRENETEAKLQKMYSISNEIIFPIHTNENTYQFAKRLKKLISNTPGVVLTNFYEELATLHIYRRKKKIIFFICHDEWYLMMAKKFNFLIDVFIAHNEEFYDKLISLFPKKKEHIYYIPYGVEVPEFSRQENFGDGLRIVFLARMNKSKGVYDIPLIQEELERKGINVKWTIIGDGPEKQGLIDMMARYNNVAFYAPEDNLGVLNLLKEQDIYILPSRLDGLPVSMLEAMSVGCVPIISEFNQGIKRILPGNIGTIVPIGDVLGFAESIAALNSNREELEERSMLSKKLIEENFNIKSRAKEYFDLFAKYRDFKKRRHFKLFRYDTGFLDNPIIPAIIRTSIRRVIKIFNNKRL